VPSIWPAACGGPSAKPGAQIDGDSACGSAYVFYVGYVVISVVITLDTRRNFNYTRA